MSQDFTKTSQKFQKDFTYNEPLSSNFELFKRLKALS